MVKDLYIFLTSRLFAIILFLLSLVVLVFLDTLVPPQFRQFFIFIPAFLFLSTLFCLLKRIFERKIFNLVFMGSVVFHIGLLLVIIAFVVGELTRYIAEADVPLGDVVFVGEGELSEVFVSPKWFSDDSSISIELLELESKYVNGFSPVERRAKVLIKMIGDGEVKKTEGNIYVNKILTFEGYNFIIKGGLYVPYFDFKDSDGNVIFSGYAEVGNSSNFESTFKVPDTDFAFKTRFFNDVVIEDGKVSTKSMEYKNPAFGVRVTDERNPFEDIGNALLKPGSKASFEEYDITLKKITPLVVLYITKDKSYALLFAGWIVTILGLILRYYPLLTREGELNESIEEEDLY